MRRTGAQWLARRGLLLWAVQYQGRWGSDAVRAYTAQAYAEAHASLSSRAAAASAGPGRATQTELWELVERPRGAAGGPVEGEPSPAESRSLGEVFPGDVRQEALRERERSAVWAKLISCETMRL